MKINVVAQYSQLNQINKAVPLIVAGGGGGLGLGKHQDEDIQQAQGLFLEKHDFSGQIVYESSDEFAPGPGGGWRRKEETALDPRFGASLLEGARGGFACYKTGRLHGFGGFGGGLYDLSKTNLKGHNSIF